MLEPDTSVSDALKILHFARSYEVEDLIPICSKFIRDRLEADNCVDVLQSTQSYDDLPLAQEAFEFIEKYDR
jgi:hypothetical protein